MLSMLVLVLSFSAAGQKVRKLNGKLWLFSVDVGIGKSIGGTKLSEKQSSVSSTSSFSYYSNKEYVNPSLRLRANIKYKISPSINVGLQSGITWHTNESYFGSSIGFITVPVQATGSVKIISVGSKHLLIDAAAGINVFKLYEDFLVEKTGALLSIGLLFQHTTKLFYRLGYEYQTDHCSYHILNDPFVPIKEETYHYIQKRQQLYLGIGVKF